MLPEDESVDESELHDWPQREFYSMREELARAYQPHHPEELLLLNHITRTWLPAPEILRTRIRTYRKTWAVQNVRQDLDRFNSLQRAIAGAERMWRQAVKEFHARGAQSAAGFAAYESLGRSACTARRRSRQRRFSPGGDGSRSA